MKLMDKVLEREKKGLWILMFVIYISTLQIKLKEENSSTTLVCHFAYPRKGFLLHLRKI